MKLKVYVYEHCDLCQRALEFLDQQKVDYVTVPIRENPPTRGELKRMLRHQDNRIRRVLNTSGVDFIHLKLGERLRFMSEQEILGLMERNGNLIRRPFVLTDEGGLVGFRQEEWKKAFQSEQLNGKHPKRRKRSRPSA